MNKKITSLLFSLSLLFSQTIVCADGSKVQKAVVPQAVAPKLSDDAQAKQLLNDHLALAQKFEQEKKQAKIDRDLLYKNVCQMLKDSKGRSAQEIRELKKLKKEFGSESFLSRCAKSTAKLFFHYKSVMQPINIVMSCYQDVRNVYFLYSLATVGCGLVGHLLKSKGLDKIGPAIGGTAFQVLGGAKKA